MLGLSQGDTSWKGEQHLKRTMGKSACPGPGNTGLVERYNE